MELAQSNYPKPTDYDNKEKLIIDYTFATGRTDGIKRVVDYLDQQTSVKETIGKKYADKESYKI